MSVTSIESDGEFQWTIKTSESVPERLKISIRWSSSASSLDLKIQAILVLRLIFHTATGALPEALIPYTIVLHANKHCFPGQTSRYTVCVAQVVTCTLAFTLNRRVLSSRELIPSLNPDPNQEVVQIVTGYTCYPIYKGESKTHSNL